MNKFIMFITRGWAAAITLSPFGIYFQKQYMSMATVVNHEKIHWKQQLEMLIILFYLWYVLEWLIKLIKYGRNSYSNISFEREAEANEQNLNYLDTRKHYAWIRYIFTKS